MKNSSRLAWLIAASTPTPWSSSWFHIASIFGSACRMFAVTCCPDSTVNEAACRALIVKPYFASVSLKPRLRSWVSCRLSMPAISTITGLLTFFAFSCSPM